MALLVRKTDVFWRVRAVGNVVPPFLELHARGPPRGGRGRLEGAQGLGVPKLFNTAIRR